MSESSQVDLPHLRDEITSFITDLKEAGLNDEIINLIVIRMRPVLEKCALDAADRAVTALREAWQKE